MGVGKKLLSSLLAASVLLSVTPGMSLANTPNLPNLPDRSELPELKAPLAPRAEHTTTKTEYERVVKTDLTRPQGVRQYFVELEAPSGVEMQVQARRSGLKAQSLTNATREHLRNIERAQQDVIQQIRSLKGSKAKVEVLYQVKNVLNGIAVRTDEVGAEMIRRIPGVKSVSVMELHERGHVGSVPVIGGPEVWESFGVLGEGIKVAVIDSGIDYIHTNFGGPGTPEAYALDTTKPNPYFPNAKVAGGWDFAGDDYDAGSNDPSKTIPKPDPNPMDCRLELGGGHGTHVAGTIAGYGVNADGTTYRGPYDASIPLDTMRIGPGVAPLAELYALRVFGCDGSTGLVAQALDWVVDPNGDGDYSDRMDVANLSLGSIFGGPDDPSARAANNAALAGVLVAISAGNSGDVYYITGSPSTATYAISVAAQVDAVDVADGFRIDAPAEVAGLYGGTVGQNFDWLAMTEPVTAPVVYDPGNPAGCSPWPAGALEGKIVFVDWIPEGHETFPCGSAARANNAAAAGAVGIIMAEPGPFLTTAIAGNNQIPSILTVKPAADAIKNNLDAGVAATLSNEWLGRVSINAPERNDTLADFSSRGPRKGNALKPDVSAPGYSIFSARSGSGNQGVSFNGTSMAAPHVAGILALLREKNPDWSVEEIKALVMNTAGHDLYEDLGQRGNRYGQSRVGAGRVNAAAAINNRVVAYSADDPGAVSVSFGAVEVVGQATFERRVKIVNHTNRTVTYRPSVDMFVEIPGLEYSFPDGDVTVPAGGSATFRVRLTADASRMKSTHDPTVAETQFGYDRAWLPEHSGVILLKPVNSAPGATATLRVPVYVTARPAADIRMNEESLNFTGPFGFDVLTMTGTGLDTGDTVYDYFSFVTPFELQHVGTVDSLDKAAGIGPSAITGVIQYAGVTTDALAVASWGLPLEWSELYFGIVAHADWSTPAQEVFYEVQVRPEGSKEIYYVYNSRAAFQVGNSVEITDVMVACVVDGCYLNNNGLGSQDQTGLFNNNVLIFPVWVTDMGLDSTRTKFQWRVVAEHYRFGVIDETPWYEYDFANPGLDFTYAGYYPGQPTWIAQPGYALPVLYNASGYQANGSKGILLLHNLNARGNRAQVVGINAAPADTGFIDWPENVTYGDAPFTVTAKHPYAHIGSLTQDICEVGPTVDGTATVTPLLAGNCVLRAQFEGSNTEAPAYADLVIPIRKAELVVTPDSVTRLVGTPNPELTGTVTGFVAGDEEHVRVRYGTAATAGSPAGSYRITVHFDDPKGRLANYEVTIHEAFVHVVDELSEATFPPDFGEVQPATGFAIEFQWQVNETPTENPSALVRILNAANGALITSFVMNGGGLTYEDGVYRVDFDPQAYGLGPGDSVTIQIYVNRKLRNQITITLE